MALGNFYEIVIAVVGSPANQTQEFLVYLASLGLGCYMLYLFMQFFQLVNTFVGGRK